MTFTRLGIAAAIVAASALWASPAQAADGLAFESGTILNYQASAGAANNVVVRLTATGYTIDDVVPIITGFNCKHRTSDLTIVECAPSGINEVRIWTNDLNDYVDYLTPTFSRIFLGDGDDQVFGGTGMDWLFGGNGNDYLNGWSGNDQFYWDPGTDQWIGGSGWDYAIYKDATSGVVADLDGVADDGPAGENDQIGADIERLEGSAFNDILYGNNGDNELFGGGGNDSLYGGGGNDDLYGDMGSGTIGTDYFSGGSGTDRVSYSDHNASQPVVADLDGVFGDDGMAGEGDTIASDVENLAGSEGNDLLSGNSGANVISGRDGNDTIYGLGGNDTLHGDNGSDVLNGGSGTDVCLTGPGGTSATGCE
jgi:Ca2+-binding RTX toxin-like protein